FSCSGLRTGGRCSYIERAAASSVGAPAPGANCSERWDILYLYSTSQGRRYVRYQATGFMACLPPEVVGRQLASDSSGLSSEEAARRLERYGPNRLAPPRRRGPLLRFALQFHNLLIY